MDVVGNWLIRVNIQDGKLPWLALVLSVRAVDWSASMWLGISNCIAVSDSNTSYLATLDTNSECSKKPGRSWKVFNVLASNVSEGQFHLILLI